ncbi:MAG: septum formation initiator [Flavobacteriales bacterium]|nr:septum formation initiator [Flavobacteriales bacterium]|tara:strand:- start:10130 stop:10432 length:303 start_codon:yes stop_codon:yes gene_type:complete
MQNVKTIFKLLLLKLKNPFILIGLIFFLWMIFFDSNSFISHKRLSKTIDQLRKDQNYYKEQIKSDSITIEKLSNKEGLEKYAREKYHMKKENEEIFLIED